MGGGGEGERGVERWWEDGGIEERWWEQGGRGKGVKGFRGYEGKAVIDPAFAGHAFAWIIGECECGKV